MEFVANEYRHNREVSAAEVLRAMAKELPGEDRPSRQTVFRMLREFRELSAGETWRFAPEDGNAPLVMPILGAVIEVTEWRRWTLTRREAEWAAAIRRVAPSLLPWEVYRQASAYVMAEAAKDDAQRESLDRLLALAVMEGSERVPPARPVPEGGLPGVPGRTVNLGQGQTE